MQTYKISKISQIEKNQLSDFYRETYHKRYKSLTNNWRWWYRVGHSKFEPLILLLDNKVIGQAGLLPVDLNILKEKVEAIYFVDFAILPKYQRKGFGQILTKEWMKICPNQITFCNDKSLKVFKKLGWKNDLSTKRLSKPINILKFLPVLKSFKFNFIDQSLRHLIKKRYNRKISISPYKISDNFKIINDSLKLKKNSTNNEFASIIRDEKWLNWRLMECPYKKDIYFFEYKNNFAIVHIFFNYVKRLNILYTYSTDLPLENELFILIINWALNNDIDFVWAINKNTELNSFFPKILNKSLQFASWSSDKKTFKKLGNGLLDLQGIDTDNESCLFVE